MRFFLFVSAFILLFNIHAEKPDSSKAREVKYKLKLNFIDQSYATLPTIKISNELFLKKGELASSINLDLGYNYYSVDERVRARGYYFGANYNQYLGKDFNTGHGVSLGAYYLRSTINDYLKVDHSLSGLGDYHEYEKMKYHKERFGVSIEYFAQFDLPGDFFIELRGGPGFLYMHSITPDRVTQQTFVNGPFYGKEVLTPNFIFNVKVGYLFF